MSLLRRASSLALTLAAGAAGLTPLAAQSLPGTISFTAPGFTILDNRTNSSHVNVNGISNVVAQTGTNLTVRLNGLMKTGANGQPAPANDWRVRLVYAGHGNSGLQNWTLFDLMPGNSRTFNGSYSFNNSFEPMIGHGANASGDYRPVTATFSTALNGFQPNGSWALIIEDHLSNGGGTIDSWELGFTMRPATSTVPEPGTYALMATGLVGLGLVARRRR